MKLTALIFTFWIVTWTHTAASMDKYSNNWHCEEKTEAEVYTDEMQAGSRAAALEADGYKNVEFFKADPAKVTRPTGGKRD